MNGEKIPLGIQALTWIVVAFGLFTMAHQIGLAIFG
jgi:hypothetical protein